MRLCRLLFALVIVSALSEVASAQQWNGGSDATGVIHRLGAVGVGLTSPAYPLDVSGVIQADTLMIDGAVGIALSTALSSVYVGTGSPSATGGFNTYIGMNVAPNNTAGHHNVAIGYEALRLNTTGFSNTAVGVKALMNNTTGNDQVAVGNGALEKNTTGAANTALGYSALSTNTTGSENTAVGRDALQFNTEGQWNTAVGNRALEANTTGQNNAALGWAALLKNTTGGDNTGVGRTALANNTTGGQNTAVGTNALNANTTGTSNTAMGSDALFANTTGGYNTAVGKRALYQNTEGQFNTALGYRTLYSNTTGSQNVALGYQTLYNNISGGQNVALGQDALYQNTSGSYNIAIGREALKQNTTGTYNVALGFSALTSNTTGSSNTAIGPGTLVANTTGHNTTAIGNEALRFNTIGTGNVGVGYRALYTNTTGSSNTSVGRTALYKNTTGSQNTSVGFGSLYENTTGANNAALGHRALHANTGGNDNTAVGYEALVANTTGVQNTAVGRSALHANTTASENTAVGYGALVANTTGERNTALGRAALYTNSTGERNTALGYSSLYYNTTGIRNTAVGFSALEQNTTGGSNTAVGYGAGKGLQQGSTNTLIGYQAGDTLTTGSNNIIIGYGMDAPTADASDHLNIGNTLYGNLGLGRIGVGAVNPTATLHVSGDGSDLKLSSNDYTVAQLSALGPTGGNEDKGLLRLMKNGATYVQLSSDGESYINNGNVGIGTTTPGYELDVVGTINATEILVGGQPISAAGSWDIANTDLYYTTGNVGIGIATPSAALHSHAASEQLRLGYDASNYASFTTNSGGDLGIVPTGGEVSVTGGVTATGTGSFLDGKAMFSTGAGNAYLSLHNSASNREVLLHTAGDSYIKGGNVGIGTSTPGAQLHVEGSTLIQPAAGDASFVVKNGGGRYITTISNAQLHLEDTIGADIAGIITGAGEDLPLKPGGAETVRFTASGEVGVGIDNPQAKLHVMGTGQFTDELTVANTSSGGILFSSPGQGKIYREGSNGDLVVDTQAAQDLVVQSGGTELMRVDGGGNVGIGTGTPGYELDVAGTINATKILVGGQPISATGSWDTTNNDLHYTAGNVSIGTATSASKFTINQSTTDATNEVLTLTNQLGNANDAVSLRFNAGGGASGTFLKHLRQGTQGGDFAIFTAPTLTGASTERFRITNSGNVGIGTDDPTATLDVRGSSAVYNDFAGYSGRTDNAILPNGKQASLVIHENTSGSYTPGVSGQTTYRGGLSFGYGGPGMYSVNPNPAGSPYYGDLRFQTTSWDGSNYYNADRMVIQLNGNVGIGATAPNAKLKIEQAATGDLLFLETTDANSIPKLSLKNDVRKWNLEVKGTDGDRFNIRDETGTADRLTILGSNGNVGIGTTNPQSKLAVDGTITSKEVVVTIDQAAWPDYVFEEDYDLRSLSKVEQFIEENGHLPEVPSATEVGANGVAVGDMQATLLKKIEELTLYLLEQKTQIDTLTQENKNLNNRLSRLEDDNR